MFSVGGIEDPEGLEDCVSNGLDWTVGIQTGRDSYYPGRESRQGGIVTVR
jgi:hypothetical protein